MAHDPGEFVLGLVTRFDMDARVAYARPVEVD